MAYEKLTVYKVVKGEQGEQGEQGDQGDQGKGYTGQASAYSAYMDDNISNLSLHQVKTGTTAGVVWMVAEAAINIGAFSYVTVTIAVSGAEVLDAKYVKKCDSARFYKLSKNPKITKTLFSQGSEEIRVTPDGYLAYSNGLQSDDSGDSEAPSGFSSAVRGSSMQFSYFVRD